ncbi:DUF6318 family protein [Actinopolymorpha sp. B9G3]|uniref:DUF6318 family protein n=1 Tax=Actinopolymorpha sp. B9G3 TaxID=3158970 RepID=UPI0032D993C5
MPVACANNPEPTPVDTASKEPTSKSPAASETPSPSPSPSAAAGSVEEQIHAATVAFYNAVNEAYETLDSAPIEALTVPGSGAGQRYIDYIESVKSKGHRFEIVGEGLTVRNFKLDPRDADDQFESATFTLMDAGATEVDGNGKAAEKFPPDSWRYRVEFQKKGDLWLVLRQRQVS